MNELNQESLYIDIDLGKFEGVIIGDMRGGKCVAIPIEANNIFVKDDKYYLRLYAHYLPKDYCTHILFPIGNKDTTKRNPIVGNVRTKSMVKGANQNTVAQNPQQQPYQQPQMIQQYQPAPQYRQDYSQQQKNNDDLPF